MARLNSAKRFSFRSAKWAGLCVALLFSCTPSATGPEAAEPLPEQPQAQAIVPQLLHAFSTGMSLRFDTLDLKIPSSASRDENLISLDGSSAQIQLAKPSLHGLSFALDAPISYHGIEREVSLTLFEDQLYFSLSADRDDRASYTVKYTSSLAPYDAGGVDETTRGISYYEYGDLDYVLAEILTLCGVNELNLDFKTGGLSFDWDAIFASMDAIVSYDSSRFLWELPIAEQTYRVGLVHDVKGILSGIELPLKEGSSQGYATINDDFHLRLDAKIEEGTLSSWTPRYPVSEYVQIKDSLALFRQIAKFAQRRKFGIDASFTLSHTEDALEGDETHFAQNAVAEDAYLNLFASADFSSSFFGGLHAELALGQTGGEEKDILLHSEEGSHENNPNIYLNVNDVLKVKTSVDVCDALVQSLTEALGDENIQNERIMELLSSLMSTANGISEAIKAVQESAFYENIDRKHFEDILKTITDFTVSDNQIELTIDLSAASLLGSVTVILNGTADNVSLGKVILDQVGLRSNNDTKTTFILDGELEITPYQDVAFDPSGYTEMTHLPHWSEEISLIAEHDQLQAQIEGYALKKGTTSAIHSATANAYVYDPLQKKGRTETGMAFHGTMAFDLAQKRGTGNMTFLDLKENYVNDHNLKIDFTGEEGESDSDQNDLAGSGNENAMFFEYNSQNVTAAKGSTAYNAENRIEPDYGALKGRFSVHSLNGLLDVILELTESTDARFERLTNLVASISAETLLTELLAGEYFELLSSKILLSAEIASDHSTFVIAPGVIQQKSGLTLTLGYDGDNMPSTIEIWITLDGEEHDTDVYAKITLGSTDLSSFPYQFSSHAMSEFKDYSTIKQLLEFALGTITLGVTDHSSVTTYHLGGTINLKILTTTYPITIDVFIFLNGTDIKILGALHVPEIKPIGLVEVTEDDTYLNFYYESNGSDTAGDLFMRRITINPGTLVSDKTETTYRRVHGADFGANILEWLLNYMLHMGSIVTGNLNKDSSSAKALHGEDLIRGWSVSGTLANPQWVLTIGMKELIGLDLDLFEDLTVTIKGKTATYSESNVAYSKKSLYSLVGDLNIKFIGISAASAHIDLSIKNISDSGVYSDGWSSSSHKATIYQGTNHSTSGWLIKYDRYTIKTGTAIPSVAFADSTYGKTTANGTYANCPYYATPTVLA